jgi:hypothetical protein
MIFSLVGDRLHVIDTVLAVSGTSQTWRIEPPLRRAYATGSRVELERPKLRAHLLPESARALALAFGRHGAVDLTFHEVFE